MRPVLRRRADHQRRPLGQGRDRETPHAPRTPEQRRWMPMRGRARAQRGAARAHGAEQARHAAESPSGVARPRVPEGALATRRRRRFRLPRHATYRTARAVRRLPGGDRCARGVPGRARKGALRGGRRAVPPDRVGMAAVAAFALVVGFLAQRVLAKAIIEPIKLAVGQFEKISTGDLTGTVVVPGENEMAYLLHALKRMQDGLVDTVNQAHEHRDDRRRRPHDRERQRRPVGAHRAAGRLAATGGGERRAADGGRAPERGQRAMRAPMSKGGRHRRAAARRCSAWSRRCRRFRSVPRGSPGSSA